MDSNLKQWNKLVEKFKHGTLDDAERRQLFYYYNLLSRHQETGSAPISADTEKKIWAKIKTETGLSTPKRPWYTRPALRYAAAALILFVCAVSYFVRYDPKVVDTMSAQAEDAAPGIERGTLRIGDRGSIDLDDERLKQGIVVDGLKIGKTPEGIVYYESIGTDTEEEPVEHELRTDRGQTIRLMLPDRSVVWLNAASSIRYLSHFAGQQSREISLVGEAYFEVAHDTRKPFKVHTSREVVVVKGTKFNLKSYTEEYESSTTVTQGRVEVTAKSSNETVLLHANEQAIIRADGVRKIRNVDTELYCSWVDNYFKFDGNLEQIMQSIARWYNVDVAYEKLPRHKDFYGKISRQKSLKEVLEIISLSSGIQFKYSNNKIHY